MARSVARVFVASIVTSVVCALSSAHAQGPVLLSDSFDDGVINPASWQVILPFSTSSVAEQNGHIEFQDRGYLTTVAEFDAAAYCGLRVHGYWTVVSADDIFSVRTRTDAVTSGQYGELQNGLRFGIWGDNGGSIYLDGVGWVSTTPSPLSASLAVSPGMVLEFEAIDSVDTASFLVTQVGAPTNTAYLTCSVAPDQALVHKIAFSNREATAGHHTAYLDDVLIEAHAGALSYCTSSTTTHGCTPSIAGSGTPNSTQSSGFNITITGVEGQKNGLIFYGTSPTAVAWAIGSYSYVCVAPPVQRTAIINSGGTLGGCDGVLTIDFNSFMASNPTAYGSPFMAGEVFYAQGWFRDSGAVKGTNLSNGLRFTLCN